MTCFAIEAEGESVATRRPADGGRFDSADTTLGLPAADAFFASSPAVVSCSASACISASPAMSLSSAARTNSTESSPLSPSPPPICSMSASCESASVSTFTSGHACALKKRRRAGSLCPCVSSYGLRRGSTSKVCSLPLRGSFKALEKCAVTVIAASAGLTRCMANCACSKLLPHTASITASTKTRSCHDGGPPSVMGSGTVATKRTPTPAAAPSKSLKAVASSSLASVRTVSEGIARRAAHSASGAGANSPRYSRMTAPSFVSLFVCAT
mmetsp:Transcript_8318/g.33694  ORF Transcript_8318/g.33694 Transcript_8318/m.33694 type:complete len:270 (-) Transcript_8318:911-1720(-)